MVRGMGSLNTIIEFEGPVVDVRRRWWAAHKAAAAAIGLDGPPEDEFWRLVRKGSPDGMIMRHARPHQLLEYTRIRTEQQDSTALMALDEPQPALKENLRVLKQLGTCRLITTCRNQEGINATLDRLDVWMCFERRIILPEDRNRRLSLLRELAAGYPSTLAIVGSVPVALAAANAGCRCVGLKEGLAYPNNLRQVGVDAFFDTLDALTDAVISRHADLQRIGLHF